MNECSDKILQLNFCMVFSMLEFKAQLDPVKLYPGQLKFYPVFYSSALSNSTNLSRRKIKKVSLCFYL